MISQVKVSLNYCKIFGSSLLSRNTSFSDMGQMSQCLLLSPGLRHRQKPSSLPPGDLAPGPPPCLDPQTIFLLRGGME